MNSKLSIGEQLGGQTLYERQKTVRTSQSYLPGPTVVSVGLQAPENIGSVFRLADAAGCKKVLFIGNDNGSPYSRSRIHRLARNCEALVEWETWTERMFFEASDSLQPLLALELTTHSRSIFSETLALQCALMIGSERHGIPSLLLSKCERAIHIPMYGVNGSMNVTHALAVALFEWRRQHP